MATVRAFKAIRPAKKYAPAVASLPYDVMNRQEAAAMAEDNPNSFLRISRAQSRLELVSTRGDFDVSWVALEHAVGSKLQKGDILDALETSDEPVPPAGEISGDIVAVALARRPELNAYRFYGERAAQLVKATSGQRQPKVTLSGHLNSDHDDRSWADDRWYVQLEVQWALYDGGAGAAAVRKAKAAARELLYVMENLSSQVRQETVQERKKIVNNCPKKNHFSKD